MKNRLVQSVELIFAAAAVVAPANFTCIASTLASPPPQYTREQIRQMAITNFRQGRPLVLAIATERRDVLTVRIVHSFSGNLKKGKYSRTPHGVVVPTPGYLGLNDLRLSWLDKDVGWPQPLPREAALALVDAGLISDRSVLKHAP